MTRILIVRHGNTFSPDETPRRVGGRTDLPLVKKGQEQAFALGCYLREHQIIPDAVYTGTLRRTIETAQGALQAAGIEREIQSTPFLNEIDYGPDENKLEEEVIARIGAQALRLWDESGVPPSGWNVDPEKIVENWKSFAEEARRDWPGGTVLVVTSNGIARFAPHLTGDFEGFRRAHSLKISTGALCLLGYTEGGGAHWKIEGWNIKPPGRT